ncbi:hypothetical protein ACOVJV_23955 [Bacillus pacificus]|uniref:hypothetical protein n=2 Tax=Bacillus pacificus TaxID=2026187 RepID=UPI002D78B90D|nr:hypothetical protein [Bacillus pacificus]HDR7484888.1 hypothetical protein [Bacillus pacificus]
MPIELKLHQFNFKRFICCFDNELCKREQKLDMKRVIKSNLIDLIENYISDYSIKNIELDQAKAGNYVTLEINDKAHCDYEELSNYEGPYIVLIKVLRSV